MKLWRIWNLNGIGYVTARTLDEVRRIHIEKYGYSPFGYQVVREGENQK